MAQAFKPKVNNAAALGIKFRQSLVEATGFLHGLLLSWMGREYWEVEGQPWSKRNFFSEKPEKSAPAGTDGHRTVGALGPYRELATKTKYYTLVHMLHMKNVMHQRDLDGCPNYVRAWCRKAEVGTMQRGFRDVGYLLAPHVLDFQPSAVTRSEWQEAVSRLQEFCLVGNAVAVVGWCREKYPGLLAIIPRERQGEFVAGVIESVWEDAASLC